MDHSVTFARHYARLIWLLLHEPANVDEQKASLRALVTMSKDGAVSLTASGDAISANATAVPGALSGVADLARQLAGPWRGRGRVRRGSRGGRAARLGAHPVGRGCRGRRRHRGDLEAAGAGLAWRAIRRAAGVAAGSRTSASGADRRRRLRRRPLRRPRLLPRSSSRVALPDFGLGDWTCSTSRRCTRRWYPRRAPTSPSPASGEHRAEGGGGGGGMFEQFTASRTPTASHTELLAQLDQATGANVLTRVLDDLVAIAEARRAMRAPRWCARSSAA